jgi:hypothetical protein
MDSQTQAWIDQEEARLAETVRMHGWAIQYIGGSSCSRPGCECPTSNEPPFAYTIGLFGLAHPELLIVGVDPQKQRKCSTTSAIGCATGSLSSPVSSSHSRSGLIGSSPRPCPTQARSSSAPTPTTSGHRTIRFLLCSSPTTTTTVGFLGRRASQPRGCSRGPGPSPHNTLDQTQEPGLKRTPIGVLAADW